MMGSRGGPEPEAALAIQLAQVVALLQNAEGVRAVLLQGKEAWDGAVGEGDRVAAARVALDERTAALDRRLTELDERESRLIVRTADVAARERDAAARHVELTEHSEQQARQDAVLHQRETSIDVAEQQLIAKQKDQAAALVAEAIRARAELGEHRAVVMRETEEFRTEAAATAQRERDNLAAELAELRRQTQADLATMVAAAEAALSAQQKTVEESEQRLRASLADRIAAR